MPEHEIDLHGRTPDELRQIAADIDEQLIRLHADENGDLRDLDDREQVRFDRLTRQRELVAARLRQHDLLAGTYARHPGSAVTAFGGREYGGLTGPEAFARDASEVLRMGGRGIGSHIESGFVNPLARQLFQLSPPPGTTVDVVSARQESGRWELVLELTEPPPPPPQAPTPPPAPPPPAPGRSGPRTSAVRFVRERHGADDGR